MFTVIAATVLVVALMRTDGSVRSKPSAGDDPSALDHVLRAPATITGASDVVLAGGIVTVPVRNGWKSEWLHRDDNIAVSERARALTAAVEHGGSTSAAGRVAAKLRTARAQVTEFLMGATATVPPSRSGLTVEASASWSGRLKNAADSPWVSASVRVSIRDDGWTLATTKFHLGTSRSDAVVGEQVDVELAEIAEGVREDFANRARPPGGASSSADIAKCRPLPFNPDPVLASLCGAVATLPIPSGATIDDRTPTRISYTSGGARVALELTSPPHPNADEELRRYFDDSKKLRLLDPPNPLPAASNSYSQQSDTTPWPAVANTSGASYYSFHRVAQSYWQDVACGFGECTPFTNSSSSAQVGYYAAVVRSDGWMLTVLVVGESDDAVDVTAQAAYDRNAPLRSEVEQSVRRFANS